MSPEKGVVVRAPFWMTRGMIENFIQEKSEWIKKHLNRFSKNRVVKQYVDGEKHLFFGKEFPIKIVNGNGRNKVSLEDGYIVVEINGGIHKASDKKIIRETLLYWYMEMGIETITEKVNYFSEAMGVIYKKISLKKVSSIWGSCSPTNCLSFNRKLVMAPHEIVDYVVIHEVAHMIYRNHGPKFWGLVEEFDREYKSHRFWLRKNHYLLSI